MLPVYKESEIALVLGAGRRDLPRNLELRGLPRGKILEVSRRSSALLSRTLLVT